MGRFWYKPQLHAEYPTRIGTGGSTGARDQTGAGLETVSQVRKIADIDLEHVRGIVPHALHDLRDTLGRGPKVD